MQADKIENIYRKTMRLGKSEEIQYVSGLTLRRMAAIAGHRLTVTTEGHAIHPSELYAISVSGIYRVD
jgi:hypothetical protein